MPAMRRSFGRERVPGAVHVQARADAVANEAGLLKHSVPPPVHGVRCAGLLRVSPVDAPVRRALLGVEEVVIGLGGHRARAGGRRLKRLSQIGAERQDDSPAQRNYALL
jgi:hypothetical protein